MKLLAIDGNSIINRAFYGLRPLSTRAGFPTNAIYGFLSILQRMVDELSPDALCVTFDRKEKTFRHEAYEGYKAQRQAMPEELALQLPKLKEILDAMNIPRYELAGWEADDLLGTLSQHCEEAGWHCVIATGDKDALQLISDQTYIYLITTRMGKTTTREMDPAAFVEQYGFPPKGIIELKALMGDSSDNIPGVKGIGEKTGMTLIQTYGNLEALYAALETAKLTPSVRKKLTEGREDAFFSQDLVTIRRNAPFAFSLEDSLRKPVNQAALYSLFSELEFHKLIEQMGLHSQQGDVSTEEEKPLTVTSSSGMLVDEAQLSDLLTHWRSLDAVQVLALPGLDVVAVAWWESETETSAILSVAGRSDCHNAFLRGLFAADIRKVAHNVKDLMHDLLREELPLEGFVFDTAIAAYLLAPTDGNYDLETLGATYYKQAFPKAAAYRSPEAFGLLGADAEAMGALFSHCALLAALHDTLGARLEELGMHALYYDMELPLCAVLAKMEYAGFLVDRTALHRFGEVLKARIAETEAEIHRLAGEVFNVNSTQQLAVILFDKLGLTSTKKTKTGHSTGIEVLEGLRGEHPIIELIMAYRQLTKLNSTYVDGFERVIAADGRIHTSFQNTVTATGRLSSTEPNLQNIPVRTPLGAQMRHMFVAGAGKVLVDADYSQIELRLLAHIAQDEGMIEAFRLGTDIHTTTAAQVFGIPLDKVSGELRRRAKAVNFGIVYGMSEFSLAQDIGVTRREAGDYMQKYFDTFHGVRVYMYEIVKQARQDGFVQTLFGRRRWLPELASSNHNMRSFGERVALNMPIQGTAADIMKLAMLRVDARLQAEHLEARLILQVHDELIVECPEAEQETVCRLLEEEMAAAAALSVPLLAEAGAGKSWAEAKA